MGLLWMRELHRLQRRQLLRQQQEHLQVALGQAQALEGAQGLAQEEQQQQSPLLAPSAQCVARCSRCWLAQAQTAGSWRLCATTGRA